MRCLFTCTSRIWLILGLLLVQACTQLSPDLPAPSPSTEASLSVSEVYAWYQQADSSRTLPGAAGSAKSSNSRVAQLAWARARTLGAGSQQYVFVPLAGDKVIFAHTSWQGLRYLVVTKQATHTLVGNIVEVLLHRNTQPIDTLALFAKLHRSYYGGQLTAPTQGECYLFVYSATYQYLTGRHFQQGRLLPQVTRLAFKPHNGRSVKPSSTSQHARTDMVSPFWGPCTDWYDGETGEYITTTGDCSDGGDGGDGGGDEDGGSWGGGDGSENTGPGGYGGGGETTSSPSSTASVTIVASGIKVDPKQEVKCFTASQPATVTIYVSQPVPGTNELNGGTVGVGHTFVGIEQNGITRYVGYYPPPDAGRVGVAVGKDYLGEIHDDSGHAYNVSISTSVDGTQLASIVNYISTSVPATYNLNNYNCADFGIAISNLAGLNLPATTTSSGIGPLIIFKGRSPGQLGQDIMGSSFPSGVTVTNNAGNAPVKQGGC